MNDFEKRLRFRKIGESKPLNLERVMDALVRRVKDPEQLKRLREKVSHALRIAEKEAREERNRTKEQERETALDGTENRDISETDWHALAARIENSIAAVPQQDLKSHNRKRDRLNALLAVCKHCQTHGNRISMRELRIHGFSSPNDCHAYLQNQVTPNFCFRAQLKTSQGRSDEQFYYFTKIVPKTEESQTV